MQTAQPRRQMWKKPGHVLATLTLFLGVQVAWSNISAQESKGLNQGSPGVLACDPNSVLTTYNVSYSASQRDFIVDSIELSNIDVAACEGGRVAAVLVDRAGNTLDQTSGLEVIGSSASQSIALLNGTAKARNVGQVNLALYRAS